MCWLQLAKKTAIVTGAASGIGRAVAQTLHDAGCALVLADVVPIHFIASSNAAHEDTFQPQLPRVTSLVCDVTNRTQVNALMEEAFFASGLHCNSVHASQPPTILVNCAGITRDGWIEKMSESDWDRVLDVNLKGTFNTCQSFLQYRTRWIKTNHTKQNDDEQSIPEETKESHSDPFQTAKVELSASIVNVGSVVSEYGNLGQVNYAASKGGVVGLTRALAKECALNNNRKKNSAHQNGTNSMVRVNAILPGFVATPMVVGAVPDAIVERIASQQIALQRLGEPHEIANAIAFLASEKSRYITGTTLECSGMIAL